jgi:predicted TIM-barrel fold metal-dependent hydrolase
VVRQFPDLKMVLAHLGGWKDIDTFIECLAGEDVHIDTAFTAGYCTQAQRDAILSRHSTDRILYGSDSPWGDLKQQVGFVLEMPVSDEVKEKILCRNAERLLSS